MYRSFLNWRTVSLLAVAVAPACARARPNPLAPYVGTWQGRIYETSNEAIRLNWIWVQSADSTGSLTFGREGVSLRTHVVVATPDSVVVEAIRSAQLPIVEADALSLRFVGRADGNVLSGTVVGRSPVGKLQKGRIEGTRVETAARR